jgi:hypothetical protein
VIAARASTTKNKKKAYLPMIVQVRETILEIRPENPRGDVLVFKYLP